MESSINPEENDTPLADKPGIVKLIKIAIGLEAPEMFIDLNTIQIALGESQLLQTFFRYHRAQGWEEYRCAACVVDGKFVGIRVISASAPKDDVAECQELEEYSQ